MATITAGRTGVIVGVTNSDFATARSTGDTVTANPSSEESLAIQYGFISGRGAGIHRITRSYLYFNVSSYTGAISNVTLNVEGVTNDSALIRVIPSSAAFGGDGSSDIVVGEFFIGLDFDNPYTTLASSWSIGTNNVPLNSSAASDIQNNNAFIVALVQANNDFNNEAALKDITLSSGIDFGTAITLSFDEAIPPSDNNSLTISTGKLTINSGKFTI